MTLQLLVEIIPATSTIPLIGTYLLFTMGSVSSSILVSVICRRIDRDFKLTALYHFISALNLHFRKPTTHSMGEWTRKVFLHWLPKVLFMRRPDLRALQESNDRNKPMLVLGSDGGT